MPRAGRPPAGRRDRRTEPPPIVRRLARHAERASSGAPPRWRRSMTNTFWRGRARRLRRPGSPAAHGDPRARRSGGARSRRAPPPSWPARFTDGSPRRNREERQRRLARPAPARSRAVGPIRSAPQPVRARRSRRGRRAAPMQRDKNVMLRAAQRCIRAVRSSATRSWPSSRNGRLRRVVALEARRPPASRSRPARR